MIKRSFVFLPGITHETEKSLWAAGITDWASFVQRPKIKGISPQRKIYYDSFIRKTEKNLYCLNAPYFSEILPASEMWRIYNFFESECVYLDIETDGLDRSADVTVVGLYDGINTKMMIKDINLDFSVLREELAKYKMIVTFNGSCFDLPFIEQRYPKTIPSIPHLDLRFLCKRIGLEGGLKYIEPKLGIQRRDLVHNMTGGDALTLWKMYKACGDRHYLELLLEYNEEDIINLQKIARHCYSEMEKKYSPYFKESPMLS